MATETFVLLSKRSSSFKPKTLQSAYHDTTQGVWRCRYCSWVYEVPNPNAKQRRDHKKNCGREWADVATAGLKEGKKSPVHHEVAVQSKSGDAVDPALGPKELKTIPGINRLEAEDKNFEGIQDKELVSFGIPKEDPQAPQDGDRHGKESKKGEEDAQSHGRYGEHIKSGSHDVNAYKESKVIQGNELRLFHTADPQEQEADHPRTETLEKEETETDGIFVSELNEDGTGPGNDQGAQGSAARLLIGETGKVQFGYEEDESEVVKNLNFDGGETEWHPEPLDERPEHESSQKATLASAGDHLEEMGRVQSGSGSEEDGNEVDKNLNSERGELNEGGTDYSGRGNDHGAQGSAAGLLIGETDRVQSRSEVVKNLNFKAGETEWHPEPLGERPEHESSQTVTTSHGGYLEPSATDIGYEDDEWKGDAIVEHERDYYQEIEGPYWNLDNEADNVDGSFSPVNDLGTTGEEKELAGPDHTEQHKATTLRRIPEIAVNERDSYEKLDRGKSPYPINKDMSFQGREAPSLMNKDDHKQFYPRIAYDNEVATEPVEGHGVQSTDHKPYDIERLLHNQKAYDLICPYCGSLITKRIVIRKKRRTFISKSGAGSRMSTQLSEKSLVESTEERLSKVAGFKDSITEVRLPNGAGFTELRLTKSKEVTKFFDNLRPREPPTDDEEGRWGDGGCFSYLPLLIRRGDFIVR